MTNPVSSALIQTFIGTTSLPSSLQTSVQTALESAPPSDVVQFSQAAVQLQEAGGLFGQSGSTANPGADLSNFLQSVASPGSGSNSLAVYQGALQAQQAYALFGTGSAPVSTGITGISLLG